MAQRICYPSLKPRLPGTASQNAAQEIMLNARADGSARASFVRAIQLFRQPEGNGLLNGQT